MDRDLAGSIAKSTFDHLQTSVIANEDSGERRVQAYLAMLSAGGITVGLVAGAYTDVASPSGRRTVLLAAAIACLVVGAAGTLTTLRLAKRDRSTTSTLNRLDALRRDAGNILGMSLPWSAGPQPLVRRWRWTGLTGQLTLLNSAVLALGAGAGAAAGRVDAVLSLSVGVVAFALSMALHCALVIAVYRP